MSLPVIVWAEARAVGALRREAASDREAKEDTEENMLQ